MAIVLKNSKYDLKIESNIIIGVMGKYYEKFLKSLNGDDVFYLDKKTIISGKKVIDLLGNFDINVLEDFMSMLNKLQIPKSISIKIHANLVENLHYCHYILTTEDLPF